MTRLTALLTAAACALTACDVSQSQSGSNGGLPQIHPNNSSTSVAPLYAPSGPVVDNFARSILDSIQARSIAESREYCGYIFIDGAGFLQSTPPAPGTPEGCELDLPMVGQGIIASYHTHGSHGSAYHTEVPSALDLAADFQSGIDGYVSTPGGRVWLVDFQTQTTYQLCGLRCVTSDPRFDPKGNAAVHQSYTIETLQRRFAGF